MDYELEKKHHVSCCGSYCHLCDWHTGKIRRTFRAALTMLDTYGFKKQLAGQVDRDGLRTGLETLAESAICPGCKQGALASKPQEDRCAIRQCCVQKGYDLCCECGAYPCETLRSNAGVVQWGCLENLARIKESGIVPWIDEEWRRFVQ